MWWTKRDFLCSGEAATFLHPIIQVNELRAVDSSRDGGD